MDLNLDEHYDKIYRYCCLRINDPHTAEDITQETFLRFLQHPEYDGDKALFYLYRIAGNLCVDRYRDKNTLPLDPETPDSTDYEQKVINNITLKKAIANLSPQDRELVLLRYINEVPLPVICKLYDISRFALYRRLKNIIAILRHEFGERRN